MILSSRSSRYGHGKRAGQGRRAEAKEESTFELRAVERRANKRYPRGKAAASCLLRDPQGALWPAEVRDISAGGISIALFRPVERGTVLNVELANKVLRFTCRIQVKVLHTRTNADGGWIIGGSFSRKLSASELQALV